MAITDELNNINNSLKSPAADPSKFVSQLMTSFITILTSISFDPLKGAIIIPGANEFLRQTIPGFVSLTAQPSLISISVSATNESDLVFKTIVNTNSINTMFTLQIANDSLFKTDLQEHNKNISNINNEIIINTIEIFDINDTYFYRIILSNVNGSLTSQTYSIKPNTIIINNKDNREI